MQRNNNEHQSVEIKRQERASIPQNIEQLRGAIAVYEQEIASSSLQIADLKQREIDPLTLKISRLEARKTRLTAPARLSDLSVQMNKQQRVLDTLAPQITSVNGQLHPLDAELLKLNSAISTLQHRQSIEDLNNEIAHREPVIQKHEALLREYNPRRATLASQLAIAESTLSSLTTRQNYDLVFNHIGHSHYGHYDSYDHHHHHHHHHGFGDVLHTIDDMALNAQVDSKRGEVARLRRQLDALNDQIHESGRLVAGNRAAVANLLERISGHSDAINKLSVNVRQTDLLLDIAELRRRVADQERLRDPHFWAWQVLKSRQDECERIRDSLHISYDTLQSEYNAAEAVAAADAEIAALNDAAQIDVMLERERLTLRAKTAEKQRAEDSIANKNRLIDDARKDITRLIQRQVALADELVYPDAVDRFEALLNLLPDNASPEMRHFYDHGWKILTAVKAEKARSDYRQPHEFDQRLYADILNSASNVLETQASAASLQELDDVAQRNQHGKRSIAKTVVGAIALFIGGAVTFACSLMLAKFIPCLSWPAAAFGVAAGVGMVTLGITLLVKGRQKGIDKMLRDYREIAPRAYEHQRLFYQPPPAPVNNSNVNNNGASAPPAALVYVAN